MYLYSNFKHLSNWNKFKNERQNIALNNALQVVSTCHINEKVRFKRSHSYGKLVKSPKQSMIKHHASETNINQNSKKNMTCKLL